MFSRNIIQTLTPSPFNNHDGESLPRLNGELGTDERRRVLQEFASLLYLEVLKGMRATISQAGLFVDESLSRDLYGAMFNTEVARLLAQRDQEGLSRLIERVVPKSAPASSELPALAAPFAGPVSARCGPCGDPVGRRSVFDAGLDLPAKQVATMRDVRDGDVSFKGPRKNDASIQRERGSGIVHQVTNVVNTGDLARAAAAIAIARSTGKTTSWHVAFEMRQDDKPVDPASPLSVAGRRAELRVA